MNSSPNNTNNKTRNILLGLLLLNALVIIIVSLFLCQKPSEINKFNSCCGSSLLIFIVVSVACILGGSLLGFLFAIPRANKDKDKDNTDRQPAYKDNTNLEDISDWLTKIIVGVSLIQFDNILNKLHQTSINLSLAFCCGSLSSGYYSFAYASILFFVFNGFGLGYIWTRMIFTKMLFENLKDRELYQLAAEAQNQKQIQVSNSAYSSIDLKAVSAEVQAETINKLIDFKKQVKTILDQRPIIDSEDTQKRRWGGIFKKNGKILTARVRENKKIKGFFDVKIIVENEQHEPLKELVAIFVDGSFDFPDDAIYIDPSKNPRGIAEVDLIAYEAFTVGAFLEDGTELEMDLNEQKGAGFPKKFFW